MKPQTKVSFLAITFNLIVVLLAMPSAEAQEMPDGLSPYVKDAVEHYNHAVQLHASGNLSQAEKEYRAAVQTDPRVLEAWSNLAVIYASEHRTKEANEAKTRATSIRKESASLINRYGEKLQSSGKNVEAIKEWDKALHLDPTLAAPRKHLKEAGIEITPF